MATDYYSLANSATSTQLPEDMMVTTLIEDGTCSIRGCLKDGEHEHFLISWDGNGHSDARTWISADEKAKINLEDAI